VRVTFRWTDDGLTVLIDDDGIRSATRRAGADPNRVARDGGYTSMMTPPRSRRPRLAPVSRRCASRTELFGGVFNAYAVPGVGFSISAAFPQLRHVKGVPGATPRD
jgi:hypothetical protein